MLSRFIPKQTFKTARYFSTATTGSEITDFVGFRQRNFICNEDYREVFHAVLGANSVGEMTDFLRAADGAFDCRMLSYSWTRVKNDNFQLDDQFTDRYVPLTTKYIRSMTD